MFKKTVACLMCLFAVPVPGLCAVAKVSVTEVQRLLQEQGHDVQDKDLAVIGMAVDLEELDLSQCGRITDRGLQHLNQLTALRTLNLTGCRRLTETGLKSLAGLTSLENLSLERVGAALNGLEHLSGLSRRRESDCCGLLGAVLLRLARVRAADASRSAPIASYLCPVV